MSDEILSLVPPPADRRIAYGFDQNQFFDLRVPAVRPPIAGFPLVINIHGGFWRSRYDLDHAGHLCTALTLLGLVTANLEYRRLGNEGGGWPAAFADVCAAYDFLVSHAEEIAVDAAKIVIMGHSAGAQLALCLAAQKSRSRGVISLAGVVDLARAYELRLSNDAVADFLAGSPSEVPEHYAKADPMRFSVNVPQFLFHGSADGDVPPDFSRAYVAQKSHTNARLIEVPGADHYDLIDPRTAAWKRVEETVFQLVQ